MGTAPVSTVELANIVASVRDRCPLVVFEQLAVSHAADDDGVWYFSVPNTGRSVQLESPSGTCPFLVESDFHDFRLVVHSVSETADVVTAWLLAPELGHSNNPREVVAWLRGVFSTKIDRLLASLRVEHPDCVFRFYDGATGSATSFQGHSFALECRLPEVPPGNPDLVALDISLCYLTSSCRISASVTWGSPSGHVEASYPDEWRSQNDWPLLDPSTLAAVAAAFPQLEAALTAAVGRRHPSARGRTHPHLAEWLEGDAVAVGRAILAHLPPAEQVRRAVAVLDLCRSRMPPIPEVDYVATVAGEPARWREGHEAFDAVRKLTLREERHRTSPLYGSLLFVAEITAKIMFNASRKPAPFDDDSSWWLASNARHFARTLGDDTFTRQVWAAMTSPIATSGVSGRGHE